MYLHVTKASDQLQTDLINHQTSYVFFLLKHRISFVSLVVKLLFFKTRHDVLWPSYLAHEKNQRLA